MTIALQIFLLLVGCAAGTFGPREHAWLVACVVSVCFLCATLIELVKAGCCP